MNPLVLGFVAVLAISSVSAGILQLPEDHDGFQTPFVPIPAPQFDVESAHHVESVPAVHESAAYYEPAIHSEAVHAVHSAPLPQPQIASASLAVAPLGGAYHSAGHVSTSHLAVAPHLAAAPHLDVAPLHSAHFGAGHAGIVESVPVVPQPTVQLHKTVIKHVQVPYPVDRYVKVDRRIPVYKDQYVKVDRPYEVVKYVQKPYIVKVERKVHVPVITKVSVPQPIVQVEPVIAPAKHIQAQQHHGHQGHHGHHEHSYHGHGY